MKNPINAPPKHLSADARRLWTRLCTDFHLDDAAANALLRAACEAFDRVEQCRKAIASSGPVVTDRFGQSKPHPLLAVERDARGQMIMALRAMRLAPSDFEAES